MISEQDKRDFFDGAFGINQAGKKVKYIGTAATDQVFRYMVAVLNEAGDVRDIQYLNDLLEGAPTQRPHNNVVGLWENRVEPFCLEKALSGHPVKLRNGQKAYVLHDEENTYNRIIFFLVGLIINFIIIMVLSSKYGNNAPLPLVILVTAATVYSAIGLDLAYEKWRRPRWKKK